MKMSHYETGSDREYVCELTEFLDDASGIKKLGVGDFCRHYAIFSNPNEPLAVRIPGGTVAEITIDRDNIITKIYVDTDYVVKTYPSDINNQVQKFIGEKLEF